jgi:hypothetical protein
MFDHNSIPTRLRNLALLWFVVGVLSLCGLIKPGLDLGFGTIEVGVLGLAFGPGLVFGWGWVPMAIRWLSWITIVISFMVAADGVIRGGVVGWAAAVICVLLISLLLEQLYILKLPEVRQYYEVIRRAQ